MKGAKNAAIWFGIGFALGVIAQWALRALQLFVINKYFPDYSKIDGFKIYPNAPTNSVYVEDIILILLSISMLLTKKIWLTLGFTGGWWISGYMGFYDAISLPKPA